MALKNGNLTAIKEVASRFPHHLFMLNKQGQTPLDICIEIDNLSLLERTKEQDSQRSVQNEANDSKVVLRAPLTNPVPIRSRTTARVMDEACSIAIAKVEDR